MALLRAMGTALMTLVWTLGEVLEEGEEGEGGEEGDARDHVAGEGDCQCLLHHPLSQLSARLHCVIADHPLLGLSRPRIQTSSTSNRVETMQCNAIETLIQVQTRL